jgi:acyl-CoA thioesterase II
LGAAKGHVPNYRIGMIASLDHAMWFHAPFRADEWLLYVMHSPRSNDGRGLSFGYIFKADGQLVVSVAQEGVIRLRKEAPEIAPGKL